MDSILFGLRELCAGIHPANSSGHLKGVVVRSQRDLSHEGQRQNSLTTAVRVGAMESGGIVWEVRFPTQPQKT